MSKTNYIQMELKPLSSKNLNKSERIKKDLLTYIKKSSAGKKLTSSDIIKYCENYLSLKGFHLNKLFRDYFNVTQLDNFLMIARYNKMSTKECNDYYDHWIEFLEANPKNPKLYTHFENFIAPVNLEDAKKVIKYVIYVIKSNQSTLLI